MNLAANLPPAPRAREALQRHALRHQSARISRTHHNPAGRQVPGQKSATLLTGQHPTVATSTTILLDDPHHPPPLAPWASCLAGDMFTAMFRNSIISQHIACDTCPTSPLLPVGPCPACLQGHGPHPPSPRQPEQHLLAPRRNPQLP